MDDKNYDTLKSAMHTVTGIAFEAGEGGTIGDLIRIRGFSARGDIFQDGMRDIAQYNRDTFNQDRIEVLRGSASMLYGRGSTGGIINQVSKQPFLLNEHSVEFTAGTDDYYRLTGDFNLKTGEDAALRVNVMKTDAKSFRNGPETDRQGIAPTYRWGIGTADEFSVGFYHLSYDDVPDFGIAWVNGRPVERAAERWYGFESDYQKDSANYGFASWLHRFADGGEIRTTYRDGRYKRDLWASTARFAGTLSSEDAITDSTVITRGNQTRGGKDRHRFLQTDYTGKADWFGVKHELLAGGEYTREDSSTYSYTFPLDGAGRAINPKGNTTWGRPGPSAAAADTRTRAPSNRFTSDTLGLYVQDMVQIAPQWKLIVGLRYDHFSGDYERSNGGPLSRTDKMWSHRFGALYQPDLSSSYYVSYGTSFNASGDLYQYDARTVNTPPEKSRNFEVGAKWDLYDGNLSLRTAVFRTEKYNERNTDAAEAGPNNFLLNAKRHTDGIEFEAAGRPLPELEIFGGVAYMRGNIDKAGQNNARAVGKDSGLTPRWTGNVWATYRLTPKWRVGIGADGMSDRVPASGEAPNAQGIVNRAPGYVKADAMVEYSGGPYTVKLNLLNLTDKIYADGIYRGHTVPGQTRAAQLTLAAKF
ncbi:TonB-dependent siderophore receptor [Eleftheria terrae]|nr:TonB-dependent siderophore receptor [Eleftheria terrae]